MADKYILDACALIAFLNDEEGADTIQSLLQKGENEDCALYLHNLNFLEVYYGVLRHEGASKANLADNAVRKLSIERIEEFGDAIFYEAGRLKANYRLSLADAVLLAASVNIGAKVVTSDHHEFDAIERTETIDFYWFR